MLNEASIQLLENIGSCNNWEILKSSLSGRGVFAKHLIKRGSLVFVNKPTLVGPRADSVSKAFCCCCYKITDKCYSCDKCHFLVCSSECQFSENHTNSCNWIHKNWKKHDVCDKDIILSSAAITFVRSMTLTDEDFQIICKLQIYKDDDEIEELNILTNYYRVPDEHLKYMKFIYRLLKTNSFRISVDESEARLVPIRGLYPLSSYLNHSCTPNTRNTFTEDLTMKVYATKDIIPGEEILTSYTGLLWCTSARRQHLYRTKGFWCRCKRCTDPTEMGTKLSALKCLNKQCSGVILPEQPLSSSSVWNCDSCEISAESSQVRVIQTVLGSLVGTLDLDNKFQLETFLIEKLAHFIPYSNHVFLDLLLRLGTNPGYFEEMHTELSESRLCLKQNICRSILRTVAALGLGDAHIRGLLLYHLHATLAERARRSQVLYEELKHEIETTIEQAYNILQGDISAPPDLELRRQYLGSGCDKTHHERFFILEI